MKHLIRFLCVWVAVFCVASVPAEAHRAGESYIFFQAVDENTLTGRFEGYVRDIRKAIPMDDDGDGKVTGAEFLAHKAEAQAMLEKALTVEIDGKTFRPDVQEVKLRKGDEIWMMPFVLPGVTKVPEIVNAEYSLLWDGPIPNHRAFAVIEENYITGAKHMEANIVAGFGPGEERQVVDFRFPSRLKVLWQFIKHGAWHIWIGFDHILFIMALLLPSVLYRKDGEWVPVEDFQTGLKALLRIVTLFTIAHSITLSLAALNIFSVRSTIVESMIALSIGVMALNNIKPVFNDRTWFAIVGFGLFHGLGFASVMRPLGLQPAVMLTSLLGFNVGVELGQLAIVSVVFPVLFLLRKQKLYVPGVLVGGSIVLTLMSIYWFTERLVIPLYEKYLA